MQPINAWISQSAHLNHCFRAVRQNHPYQLYVSIQLKKSKRQLTLIFSVCEKNVAPRDETGASSNSRPIHNPVITEAPVFKLPTPPTPTTAPSSTACVWAIASCCAPNDSAVRYGCFQRYGCNLVFWNLNPCADNIRDNVIDYLNKQFD